MTIENNDRLLINRGSTSYQIKYEKIKDQILDDTESFVDAPDDGTQYGRTNGEWTEIVHTPEYTDADVDAHLNVASADAGKILSWNGSDYAWVVDQAGSGGTGGNSESISYTYPSGQQRTVQNRLEDSVSVKDFGAKGDGVTDDTVAFQAAIQTGREVNIPSGTYKLTQTISSAGRNVSLRGEGHRTTELRFEMASGDGIVIDIDENNRSDYTAQLRDFTIHSTTSSGKAIYIRSDDPGGEIYRMAVLDDITCNGKWSAGIDLESVRICQIRNINCWLTANGETGISLRDKCMDSVLSNIVCNDILKGHGAAIFINGEAEGIHVEESTIINCRTGIHFATTVGEPALYVTSTHTNCAKYGIYTEHIQSLLITNCLFFARTTNDPALIEDHRHIYVKGAAGVGGGEKSIIANNIFHAAGRDANPNRNDIGIEWNTPFNFATITGNNFYGMQGGILATGDAQEITISDNNFKLVDQPYFTVGTTNMSITGKEVDSDNSAFVVENLGGREKNAQLKILNNGKQLKLACRKDGSGNILFEDNLSFNTEIGNTPVEILRLNDNGTARFYSDLFVNKNGVFEDNVTVNGAINVQGSSTFFNNLTVGGNIISNGNITAARNLYVGEAGNPNQRWLISVDSNGNILTVRQ